MAGLPLEGMDYHVPPVIERPNLPYDKVASYVDETCSSKVLSEMHRFYQDKRLCDIVLHVEETEFRSHRLVLAASSLYFERMFLNDMSEQNAAEIQLNGLSATGVGHLLDFAYTSELMLNTKTVLDIFEAADMLQFVSARRFCQSYLTEQIDINNCLSFMLYAHTFSSELLYEKARLVASENFKCICKMRSFLSLPERHLQQLLISDHLDMEYEEHVYEAMRGWIIFDLEARRSSLSRLIRDVRLNFVSRWYLIEVISRDPLVERCPEAARAVQTAKDQLLAQGHTYDIPWVMPASRSRTGLTEKLLYLNTPDQPGKTDVVLFDVLNKSWSSMSNKCPQASPLSTVECVDKAVVVIGGWDATAFPIGHRGPANKLYEFLVMQVFPKLEYAGERELGLRRYLHSSTVVSGTLYVVGGLDERGVPLKTMLCTRRDEGYRLRACSDMLYPVVRPAVCATDTRIFVFGGFTLQGEPVRVTQVYDTCADRWCQLSPAGIPDVGFHHAAQLGEHIYLLCDEARSCPAAPHELVGHRVPARRVDCMYRFCPAARTWGLVQRLPPRSGTFSAAVLDGRLYVTGGAVGGQPRYVVECYDAESNTWDTICKTRTGNLSMCTTIQVMHENFGL